MVDADRAREDARLVLDGDRYQRREVPRPLRGVLRWIGERIEDLAAPVVDALSTPLGTVLAVTAVVAVVGVGTVLGVRRRNRLAVDHDRRRAVEATVDPRALDREADAAEAAGDLTAAVRLRFQAGVARLEQGGAVPRRPDATAGQLVARVPSSSFGRLARTFEAVAYGGRRATTSDVEESRRAWPVVVREVVDAERADGPDPSGSEPAGAGVAR